MTDPRAGDEDTVAGPNVTAVRVIDPDLEVSARATRIVRSLLMGLAVLDVAEGDLGHAFTRLAALRLYMHPELHADTLRGNPGLAPLHADPRWRALVGE